MVVVSSCREMLIRPQAERNPIFSSQQWAGRSGEDCRDNLEEGGDDVKIIAPYDHGRHTCCNAVTKWGQTRERGANHKRPSVPDCSLQPDYTKLESLANRRIRMSRVNTFGSCAHHLNHTASPEMPKPVTQPCRGRLSEGGAGNWG